MQIEKTLQESWILKDQQVLSSADVELRIRKGELRESDWIFDVSKDAWFQLELHPVWQRHFDIADRMAPWTERLLQNPHRPEWVIREGDAPMQGPYSSTDLMQLLRSGKITVDTLLWCDLMSTWLPIYQIFPAPVWRKIVLLEA